MTSFALIYAAVRGALEGAGLQASPQAADSPQGFPRRHQGYRIVVEEIGSTGRFSDRSLALFSYRVRLLVSHRVRQTGEDGHLDVVAAGSDYEAVSDRLLGDATVNAQGHVTVSKFAPKLSPSGEWLDATCTFSVEGERSWLLDGGQEAGS